MSVLAIVILCIVIALIIAYFILSVRIVRPYQKGVVERLGKYRKTCDAGFHMIFPFVDRMTRVDMRENVVEVPPQSVITKDNVEVTVDAVIYYSPTDAVKLIYNVTNFYLAATKLAQTSLRNVVGEMQLDETLTSREVITTKLRDILHKATEEWGVRVMRVELQRIDPPADVTQAMHRQMKAERERRATILEAEGERQAAIARSERVKQSAILEAEGTAQAIREVASAEKEQVILHSEGEATSINNVFKAIHEGGPSSDLITLRYIDALKDVADGNATKIFLPLDMQGLAVSAGAFSELMQSGRVTPGVKAEPGMIPPVPQDTED
ncbi:MAG: SPFH/Band 7/PHB domain protein [Eggerthellaceae bacterium]|nr:SPFH/Band 7/PHB domain protein [Eggerthellaceae bacterium]